ncbi:MAG TPA: Holliday junction resolvase RuvX [Candidatus Paceibacterota bacterium]|nr:Holliday junction resolvase RuvX [Candidatus Paceibacterota bacterium]HPT17968.1 Holliday junction resolvase RuvX [Candidatus Paceibacterota bacterium]
MKFLGIDYGSKRIGIAISDEQGRIAFPRNILLNNKEVFEKISDLIEKEKIEEIVIGESTDFKGKPNIISKDIEIFIEKLFNKFKLRIHKQKEFLTSVEARGHEGKVKNNARKIRKVENKKVDDSAAALILQRFLDKNDKH